MISNSFLTPMRVRAHAHTQRNPYFMNLQNDISYTNNIFSANWAYTKLHQGTGNLLRFSVNTYDKIMYLM
jgi:hypothetical protein